MFVTYALIALSVFIALFIFIALLLRRVVPTNEVHIVQSSKATTSYGKDSGNGNAYYEWPSSLPIIGVTKVILPVSVFDIRLEDYPAYDRGRVPFVIDIVGFFRIENSNLAAQRVSSFDELETQLESILQGSVRAILASSDIEDIMQERATFGDNFTKEVSEQLSAWGVAPVKNLELMDVRDAKNSEVIANIMEKKKSLIEMQSRIEVANNKRDAEIAEVQAVRESDLQKTQAEQIVQLRVAEKDQAVGIANEQMKQEVHEQARVTKEKEMAVIQVNDVRRSEITKQQGIIKAEENKMTAILAAEAHLEAEKRNAQAVLAKGQAEAESKKLLELAPVEAQIVLAKEIGENEGYQKYLVTIRQIEALQSVGTAQASALETADVKVIANAGDSVNSGISGIGDLFTPKGGLSLGAALESLANTEAGKALVDKITKSPTESQS